MNCDPGVLGFFGSRGLVEIRCTSSRLPQIVDFRLAKLRDRRCPISSVLQDDSRILEVDGHDLKRTQDIEADYAVRISKLEVADHYSLTE